MRPQSLAFGIALVTAVSAAPNPLAKRTAVHDPKGNIKITFSDDTVNIGSVKIEEIIEEMSKACSTQGQCDTSSLTFSGSYHTGNWAVPGNGLTVTVEPSGAYPTWIHNGLIDGLSAAVRAVAVCKEVTVDDCSAVQLFCHKKRFTPTECTVPAYWGINFQDPSVANAAPPFIGAGVTVEKDGQKGFCQKLTTSLSAVAGAVHGVGGGIFTLLSLACKD